MNTGEPADWDGCIVGAGPAGLAVATQLAGTGLRVCVLEIGGTASDPFPHVRLTVENPYPHADIDATHSAGIGGTARQWSFELHAAGDVETSRPPVGCRYLPMQPLDLLPAPLLAVMWLALLTLGLRASLMRCIAARPVPRPRPAHRLSHWQGRIIRPSPAQAPPSFS